MKGVAQKSKLGGSKVFTHCYHCKQELDSPKRATNEHPTCFPCKKKLKKERMLKKKAIKEYKYTCSNCNKGVNKIYNSECEKCAFRKK